MAVASNPAEPVPFFKADSDAFASLISVLATFTAFFSSFATSNFATLATNFFSVLRSAAISLISFFAAVLLGGNAALANCLISTCVCFTAACTLPNTDVVSIVAGTGTVAFKFIVDAEEGTVPRRPCVFDTAITHTVTATATANSVTNTPLRFAALGNGEDSGVLSAAIFFAPKRCVRSSSPSIMPSSFFLVFHDFFFSLLSFQERGRE